MTRDPILQLIRTHKGLLSRIARQLGVERQAVTQWTRVPAERIPAVEAATGIPRHLLRPDICPPPAEPCPCERERAA